MTSPFAATHAALSARLLVTSTYDGILVDEIVALGEDVLAAHPGEFQLAGALTHHWETSEFSNDNTDDTDLLDSAQDILDEVRKVDEVFAA